MPNIASAKKRVRQIKARTQRNRMVKSRMRTYRKRVVAAVEAGKQDEAETMLQEYASVVDKAAKKNTIHKNAAARYKSSMAQLVNKLSAT